MGKKTGEKLNSLLDFIFAFSEQERFMLSYEKSLRLFMDLPPHRGIETIKWQDQDKKNFLMWFCFEVLHKDRTICDLWIEENHDKSGDILDLAGKLNRSNLALYYVVHEKCSRDKLYMSDLLSHTDILLWEPVIYQLQDKPLVFGLRVIDTGKELLSTGDFYVFPREISEDIVDFFHRHLQGYYGEEIDSPRGFPRGAGYLLNHLRLTLQRSDEFIRQKKQREKEMEKAKVKKLYSHFMVEDYELAIQKLEELPNITFLGEESGYRFYEWYYDPMLAGKDYPNAGIVLTRQKLVIHCLDIKCFDGLKSKIIEVMKNVASHIYDMVIRKKEE